MHIRRDAADLAGTGHDLTGIIAPEVEPGLLEFGIIGVLDPLAAAPRPVLIDEELVVVLDEELGGVAGILVRVAEQAAGDDQIAGKQRSATLADQSLADDQGLDSVALQVERRVAAAAPPPTITTSVVIVFIRA